MNNNNNNNKYYQSAEMSLIAYLLCKKGHELKNIDTSNRKAIFTITKTSSTNQEIANYWNFKGMTDAQTFHNQLKRLKNQLHNQY